MIDFALLQQCNIVQLLVSESSFLSADTSAIRAFPFLATVECNPVAYDIKYDCRTIVCCRGPARYQLHHFCALKVPHGEVLLTLREKDECEECSDCLYGAQSMFQTENVQHPACDVQCRFTWLLH